MKILAIETSCDETACAIIEAENDKIKVLSNVVSSQIKLHAKWGGVVPNLAAREHLKNIVPVIETSLKEAGLTSKEIDLIGVTSGPGLIPALIIGVNAAKTLSYVWQKPLLGIHHIEGHIYANFVGGISNSEFRISNKKSKINFPILCLVVSGGHTQLVYMKDHLNYKIIGETLDDAAGEAFDKVARILNIGYPGGPAIAAKAANFQFPISNFQTNQNDQFSNFKKNYYNIILPRPMLNKNNFNFSFSGLKTAVLYETKKHPDLLKNKDYISEICYEFQQATIDVLISKTLKAAEKFKPKTILLAGGVSANKELREQLGRAVKKNLKNTLYMLPDFCYSVDNATMIASAAYFNWKKMSPAKRKSAQENWKKITADANLKIIQK